MTTVIIKTNDRVVIMECTSDGEVDRAIEKIKPVLLSDFGLTYISHRIDNSFVNPADRTFRDALEDDGVLVKVNMTKARAIHLNHLRDKRTRILAALDVEWSKAVAQKNQALADQIESKRQALRDMPVTVRLELDAAKTPDEIKHIMPIILTDKT